MPVHSLEPSPGAEAGEGVPVSASPRKSTRLDSLPAWLLPVAGLVLFALILLPIIHAPWFGDDVTNSDLRGYLDLTGKSLLGVMWDATDHTLRVTGRPQLLISIVGHPVFYAIGRHPGIYHGYLLALTVLDGALLYALLRRLGWGRALALLPVILAAALMQLRIYHDSLLGYAGLIQWLLALTLISAIFFDRWLTDGRRRDLWIALGVFLLCPLIYEVTYTFVAVFVGLAFARRRGWSAFRAALPFLAMAAAFVFVSWLLRHIAPPGGVNYEVGGGIWAAIRTYFIQLFAPLPVTYFGFDPSIGGGATPAELLGAAWRGLAVAGAVALLAWLGLREPVRAKANGAIAAVGLALWLAPPALLSLTPKYQVELAPNKGYLPVLMQVFGIAILIACAVRALLVVAAARSRAALFGLIALVACTLGFAAGVTAFSNLRVLAILQPQRASRALIESAADRGLFSEVPAGSTVLLRDRDIGWSIGVPLYEVQWPMLMFANETGRRYDARVEYSTRPELAPCPRTSALVQADCARYTREVYWVRDRLRRDGGTVILAQAPGAARRNGPVTGELRVFRQADAGGTPSEPQLIGTTRRGRPWNSRTMTWSRASGGDGWAIYVGRIASRPAPLASSLDDARAFVDFTAMPPPPLNVRLLGTKELLP